MKSPRVLVLGHGRHGKDQFADFLCQFRGLTKTSSSWEAAHLIYPIMQSMYGYSSVSQCYQDRVNHRHEWKMFICGLNAIDPTVLLRTIYQKSNVYVGLRSNLEYKAALAKNLVDLIYWVDARPRVDYVDETLDIQYDPNLMIWIDNNGSLEDLENQAKQQAGKNYWQSL